MSRSVAFVCTLAAGLLVGLQPASNAALSRHVGDLGAAFVSLLIAAVLVGLLLLIAGQPRQLSGVSGIRPEHLVGALGGAVVVAVGLVAVRPLGAGAVIALLVAGQVIMSVLADRFGWFGLHLVGISASRAAGVLLVLAGTLLVTRS